MMIWPVLLVFGFLVAIILSLIPAWWGLQRRRLAEARASRLLEENLTPIQRQQIRRHGYFDVVGSKTGKRYRIHHGSAMNIRELTPGDHLGVGLCFLPRDHLVAADCMLAQKIVLENCEEEALRIALPFGNPWPRPLACDWVISREAPFQEPNFKTKARTLLLRARDR